MLVKIQEVEVSWSEIKVAAIRTWGPKAWVAFNLCRLLENLGIRVNYSK